MLPVVIFELLHHNTMYLTRNNAQHCSRYHREGQKGAGAKHVTCPACYSGQEFIGIYRYIGMKIN